MIVMMMMVVMVVIWTERWKCGVAETARQKQAFFGPQTGRKTKTRRKKKAAQ